LAHSQAIQVSYQVVYLDLEEDSVLNLQNLQNIGGLGAIAKNH